MDENDQNINPVEKDDMKTEVSNDIQPEVSNDIKPEVNNDAKADINNFVMNDNGDIRSGRDDLHTTAGAVAQIADSKTFLVLGWISAALTFLISPYFAIAGIIFGVLVNRQARGRGNALIITNIVLAVLNLIAIRLILR